MSTLDIICRYGSPDECQWQAARGKTGPYSAILLVAQACAKDSESLSVSVFNFAFKFTAPSSL